MADERSVIDRDEAEGTFGLEKRTRRIPIAKYLRAQAAAKGTNQEDPVQPKTFFCIFALSKAALVSIDMLSVPTCNWALSLRCATGGSESRNT